MRVVFPLLALLLLTPLSGCLDDQPEETEPLATVEGPPAPRAFRLDDNQTLLLNNVQVTGVAAVGAELAGDHNCLRYDTPLARDLVVEATWEPVTPLYERLELIVDGEEQQVRAQGTSPLRLEVEEVRRDSFFGVIHVIVQLERPGGVALEQPVDLHVRMEHQGSPRLQADHGGCVWG